MKTLEVICTACGCKSLKLKKKIDFKIKSGQTNFFCGPKCSNQFKKLNDIHKKCLYCSNEFITSGRSDSKKCCSKECSAKYSASYTNPKNVSIGIKNAWKMGVYKNRTNKLVKYKVCPVCSDKFYGNKKYCSISCYQNSNVIKKISDTRKQLFSVGKLNVTGGNTKWIKYKNIKVQGTYEYRTCFILDKLQEMKLITKWEYTNDRVQYIGKDNNLHNYLIDFKVWDLNNLYYYIETKGYKKENDELKWKAVRDRGDKLYVWYNEEITNQEKKLGLV
jgi:hypothetical protein